MDAWTVISLYLVVSIEAAASWFMRTLNLCSETCGRQIIGMHGNGLYRSQTTQSVSGFCSREELVAAYTWRAEAGEGLHRDGNGPWPGPSGPFTAQQDF